MVIHALRLLRTDQEGRREDKRVGHTDVKYERYPTFESLATHVLEALELSTKFNKFATVQSTFTYRRGGVEIGLQLTFVLSISHRSEVSIIHRRIASSCPCGNI